jgi:asparagine synthase (glutamine-hydrolysing)
VLLGGWGGRSIELLDLAAEKAETTLDRSGATGVIGAAGTTEGRWRCWISGRVTNVIELWERFPGPGRVDLNTAITRAHSQMGLAACDLLRGTFVLVAVDLDRDIVHISRDHLGGRPLVYTRVGDGALFAEHERDILDLLPSTPGPDRLALTQWIDGKGIPAGHTLYDGILRLPAAHRLVLSREGVSVERYWSPRYERAVPGSRGEIGERLRAEVFAAVERAAAGSHRVAVRLSGGLDSACVAAGLAARRSPRSNALALSAVFPNHPETDERDLIEAIATKTGLPSEQIAFDDGASILAPALRHIDCWRLPPMTPNLFVWEPVMAHARRLGVDVMLDGEGGDELFGLAPYLIADMLRTGRLAKAWSLTGGIPGIGDSPDPRVRLRALRVFGIGGLVPAGARRWRRRRNVSAAQGSVLTPQDLLALVDLESDTRGRELGGPLWWRALAAELTDGGDALDVAGHLQREAIDDQVDRRHPFLFDLDLVAGVLANPPQLQFDPVRDRSLLRDALTGYIPEQVRTRYSKSFFTPVLHAALSGPDGDLLVDALADADAPIRSFLRSDALDRLLEPKDVIEPVELLSLWRIGMVDAWLRANERPEYLSEVLEKSD